MQDEGLHRNTDSEGLQVVETYTESKPRYGQIPVQSQTSPEVASADAPRRICGLRVVTFWLVVVILVLVVGAALGGGIGGGLASKNGDSESDSITGTPTPTTEPTSQSTTSLTSSTSTGPVTSGTTGMAQNPCPNANQTTISSSTGSLWVLYCRVDWPAGSSGANGNGTVHDLSRYTVYSLKSCIEKCVMHNADISSTESSCAAIEYQANLTSAIGGGQGGNCFLKDRIGTYSPATFGGVAAGLVGG